MSDDGPPLRVMSLHALLYCKRLFYLEEVEELRVADAAVYAGRELHTSLEAEEDGEWCSFEAESLSLGLTGKIDCIRRRDGSLIPYEHKRGRCRRAGPSPQPSPSKGEGAPEAWPSDRVQAAAYALLVEEATGQTVREARVRYHADNVTVRVPIEDAARSAVVEAVAEARRLRQSVERPPITDNERLCARCSLAPVCLPEEVRHERDESHQPVRLFPPDDDRLTLHVVSHGAAVGRAADRFVVRSPIPESGEGKQTAPATPKRGRAKKSVEWQESRHPSREVSAVVLHGFAQISTQALRLCVDQDISVHWVSAGGRYLAGLAAGAGGVQRRLRQYRGLSDPAVCLRLARALVHAKVQGQHRYLLRATRENPAARASVQPALTAISDTLGRLPTAETLDSLRGYEGDSAVRYLGSLNVLLSPGVPDELRYDARSRRPPRDRFNALLSFGYALLHAAVMRAILAVGLEPALGFFHQPRSAAHPLVLDIMELFRVPLWDLVVIGSLNRGQWQPEQDFAVTKGKVWLSDSGRAKAIGLFEERLQEQWKHPVLNYSLSYARTIELEVRLLEKEWSGEPGLFGRSRLR